MEQINFGDVIYVERDCGIFGYKHFGVYSGNQKVIHYTKGGDAFDGVIRETSLSRFLADDNSCHVCLFDEHGRRHDEDPSLLESIVDIMLPPLFPRLPGLPGLPGGMGLLTLKKAYEFIFEEEPTIYSAKETVKRARSRIGQRGYNLFLQNCEHFAIWCKTGVEKSEQVDKFIDFLIAGRYSRLVALF